MEIIGVALLVGLIMSPLAVARWVGFSIGRIVLDISGVLVGGALCAIPSATIWLMDMVRNASGGGPMSVWSHVLVVCSSALGALAGLLAVERFIYRSKFKAVACLLALTGFAIGGAVSFLVLLLMQYSSWGEQALLILCPLSIAATTVAGYSLRAAKLVK